MSRRDFFHIDYLPLVPSQSWLVFQQSGKTWRGVKIPLSPKSLLIAWGRTASIVAGVGGLLMALATSSGGQSFNATTAELILLSLAGWGFFAFSKLHKSVTRASYPRACELARLAKLPDNLLVALAQAYNQPPPTYGFQTLPAKKIASAPATLEAIPLEPEALEAIPVDDADAEDVAEEPAIEPLVSQPRVARTETRRHG